MERRKSRGAQRPLLVVPFGKFGKPWSMLDWSSLYFLEIFGSTENFTIIKYARHLVTLNRKLAIQMISEPLRIFSYDGKDWLIVQPITYNPNPILGYEKCFTKKYA